MGADVSRERFDPARDHSGVVLQEGRLLLDADWNELVAIVDRRLRAGSADLGSTGPAPGITGVAVVPRTTPDGFRVRATAGAVSIDPGRMYVDGLLAENHGTGDQAFDPVLAEVTHVQGTPYDKQPYWPTPTALPKAGTHLAYLDVWSRELTYVEAPDLVEQAVGVDTTARTQTVWQVRVLAADATGVSCITPDKDVPGWLDAVTPSAGRLTTGTVPVPATADPCALPPTGGYRGLENQTYRVEIHDGGAAGTATFKWSRDNGSVASTVAEVVSATTLRPASLGRDNVLRFSTGDWVEVLDDHRELDQRSGEMRKIEVHEEDGTVSFVPALPADLQMTSAQAGTRHLRIRRWDQGGVVRTATGTQVVDLDAPGAAGVVPVPVGGPAIVLERGVTVQLRAPGGRFRPGDHWIFAARTNDTSVEVLTEAPPRGIHHHYARLAILTFPDAETDCRVLWPPLTTGDGGEGCDCTRCVTPESHASGALTIQNAVAQVAPSGGTVCLAAGIYNLATDAVPIVGAVGLRLRGQGPRTLLIATGAAVEIRRSAFVTLSDMAIITAGSQSAVVVDASAEVTAERLTVLVAGSEDGPGAAFELSRLALATRLRDNVVVAPAGIRGGGTEAPPLLTAALEVTDNLLVCSTVGVALEGRVAHLLANRVDNNTVLRARLAGLRATGELGPGASFGLGGNTVMTDGSAVEVGPSGFAVRDNEITGMEGSLELHGGGVTVLPGTFGKTRGATRITGNRVRGVGGAGIAVRAPVGDLDIAHNLVERAGSGIVLDDRGRALTATVTANVVRDVGSRDSDKGLGPVSGIQVVGSARAVVEGNTVDGVGTVASLAADSAGIRILATHDSRIANNAVQGIGGPETDGPCTGIQVAGFFARTSVGGNSARSSPGAVESTPVLGWTGLVIGARPPQEGTPPPMHVGGYVAVPGKVSWLVGAKAAYAEVAAEVCATVEANTVTGGGRAPAALVSVPGDVVVTGNHFRQAQDSGEAALELYAESATVTANRARNGDPSMSLHVDPKRAAVVANITTAPIRLGLGGSPGPLGGPWIALNPVGV